MRVQEGDDGDVELRITVQDRVTVWTSFRKRLSQLLLRLAALLPENPAKMGSRPWSGVCLLNKIQA